MADRRREYRDADRRYQGRRPRYEDRYEEYDDYYDAPVRQGGSRRSYDNRYEDAGRLANRGPQAGRGGQPVRRQGQRPVQQTRRPVQPQGRPAQQTRRPVQAQSRPVYREPDYEDYTVQYDYEEFVRDDAPRRAERPVRRSADDRRGVQRTPERRPVRREPEYEDYTVEYDYEEFAGDRGSRRGSRGNRNGGNGGSGRGGNGFEGPGGPDGRSHGKKPKKKGKLKKVIIAIVVILAVLIGGLFIFAKVWYNKGFRGDMNAMTNDIDPNYDVWDDYITIMVYGCDGTEDTVNGADVDILVSLNRNNGEIRMLSFYRDLLIADQDGDLHKLTGVYRSWGDQGSVASVNALNLNYDLKIGEYVTMDWASVAHAIDMLGGVTINVPEEMIVMVNGYIENTALATGVEPQFLTEWGEQNLTGLQAVAYCRIRYVNVEGYSGGDFGRSERQREVLSALFDKARNSNPFRLLNMVRGIWPEIETSLSMRESIGMIPGLRTMHIASTAGFPRADETVDHRRTGNYGSASIVYSSDVLSDISWIYEYLFDLPGYEPSESARHFAGIVNANIS